MKVKALVTDVDGTLTDKRYRLSCPAIKAVRFIERFGIPVTLASGNALCVMRTLRAYIGCSGAVICEGGGVVEYNGELRILGDRVEALMALDALKEVFGRRIVESSSNPFRYVDVALRRTVVKSRLVKVLERFPSVKLWDSGYAYHIIERDIDKGRTVKVALELMHVEAEEAVAIGDSETDVPLLEAVGYGIAVANADETLKRVTDYVTEGKNGKGFSEAVKLILSWKLKGG